MEPALAFTTETGLCSWGTSRAVRIPKKACDTLGVQTGSHLHMVVGCDECGPFITLRPQKTHRSHSEAPYISLDEAFSGYDKDFKGDEFDWGEDVGNEVIQ